MEKKAATASTNCVHHGKSLLGLPWLKLPRPTAKRSGGRDTFSTRRPLHVHSMGTSMTLFNCDGRRYDYVMLCLCMAEKWHAMSMYDWTSWYGTQVSKRYLKDYVLYGWWLLLLLMLVVRLYMYIYTCICTYHMPMDRYDMLAVW